MRAQINDTILQMGTGNLGAYDRLLGLARQAASRAYQDELAQKIASATAERISNDGFLNSIIMLKKYVVAAAGVGGAEAERVRESKKLSLPIMEGLWADLTLQFGAGKLMKAWNQAGRPTDSVDIAQMLASMGMDDNDIRDSLRRAGLDDADINATMKDLADSGDDDELDIPFMVGDRKMDNEAKQALKKNGKDGFVKYWEDKLGELESQIKDTESGDGSKADQGAIINKMRELTKNKDVEGAKGLLGSMTDINADTKKRLLGFITTAEMSDDDKKSLADLVNKATVAEMELFEELSSMLKSAQMSWKDLGYRMVVKERRTNSVILI
jgi:hypothetical protein